MLRNLLRISDQYSAPVPQKELNEKFEAIEKRNQELKYESDMKERENMRRQCKKEYEKLERELPDRIEADL